MTNIFIIIYKAHAHLLNMKKIHLQNLKKNGINVREELRTQGTHYKILFSLVVYDFEK